MAKITLEAYQEYDQCGDEFLNESEVSLTFDDDCGEKNVVLTFENYIAEDGRLIISRKELMRVLNFLQGDLK